MRDANIYCPTCDLDFEGEVWQSGKCPNCGREYWFDELRSEDGSEWWPIVEWEERGTPTPEIKSKDSWHDDMTSFGMGYL